MTTQDYREKSPLMIFLSYFKNQIRVQFASRGYPLVGDHKYGSRDERTDPMLFSCCIRFPWRGEQRRFEAMPDFGENP